MIKNKNNHTPRTASRSRFEFASKISSAYGLGPCEGPGCTFGGLVAAVAVAAAGFAAANGGGFIPGRGETGRKDVF